MDAFLALFLLFILIMAIASIAGTAFWIWMLVDCAQNRRLKDGERVGWIVVIVFTHLLGSLIYYFVARSRAPQPVPPLYHSYQAGQPMSPPVQQSYHPYQQGYPAQKPSSPQPHPSESLHWDETPHQEQIGLEQPQAQYPRLPSQE